MKRIILSVILFLLFFDITLSQDVIIKNDKSEIESKVIEITPTMIKYKKYSNIDGPIRNILIDDVFIILYENGEREIFNNTEKKLNNNNDAFENNNSGSFIDNRDNQVYNWIKIGEQIWMTENLNFKTYDGSSCHFPSRDKCEKINGRIYFYDAAERACPIGWHLPSDTEWTILVNYLGDEEVAGGKMKESSFNYWNIPNVGATNSSGFNAVPGGKTLWEGDFEILDNRKALYWSSTEKDQSTVWSRGLYSASTKIGRHNYSKAARLLVRCIKD